MTLKVCKQNTSGYCCLEMWMFCVLVLETLTSVVFGWNYVNLSVALNY